MHTAHALSLVYAIQCSDFGRPIYFAWSNDFRGSQNSQNVGISAGKIMYVNNCIIGYKPENIIKCLIDEKQLQMV